MKRPESPPNSNLKAAALIGAIAVVFAFCYWRISAGSTPPPQPEAASASIDQPSNGAPAIDHSLIDIPVRPVSTTTDPFRSVLRLNSSPLPARAQKLVPHINQSGFIGPLPLGGTLPGVSLKLVLEPSTILKGVISGGPQGVAVLSIDGKDTVVQLGAVLASGYRVGQITDGSVTLIKGASSQTLVIEVPGSHHVRPLD